MEVNELKIINALLQQESTVSDAEWALRAKYGSGQTGTKFQKIYNYLDELAGVLDGKKETSKDIERFREFLERHKLSVDIE